MAFYYHRQQEIQMKMHYGAAHPLPPPPIHGVRPARNLALQPKWARYNPHGCDLTKEIYVPPGFAPPPQPHRREAYFPPIVGAPVSRIPFALDAWREARGLPPLPPKKDKLDHFAKRYSVGKVIGKGGQGSASLGRDNKTGHVVVVKILTEYRACPHTKFINDRILTANKHPNIITLFEMTTSGTGDQMSAKMALEFCNGGDLHDFRERFVKQKTSIPEVYIWHIFHELSKALAYLHVGYNGTKKEKNWKGVIHRDIKPENIMIHLPHRETATGLPEIKLIDFDCSCTADRDFRETRAGTPEWIPPEWFNNAPSADIWSLSAVVYHLTGCEPAVYDWPGIKKPEGARRPPPFDIVSQGYSKKLDRLVQKGLARYPEHRPSAMGMMAECSKFNVKHYKKKGQAYAATRPWIWIDNTPHEGNKRRHTSSCSIA